MIRNLLLSTSSNLFVYLVSIIITFVMTPVYVRELGNYDYGVWELIISVIGYLGLIDIGLRPTISRFIAFHHLDSSLSKSREIFSTSMALTILLGAVAGFVLFTWSIVAPDLLANSPASEYRYSIVLKIMAINIIFSFPKFALESVLEGQLKYATKNTVIVLHSIISAIILYNYLPAYDPLILLSGISTFTTFSTFIIFYFLLRSNQYGNFIFNIKQIRLSEAKMMIAFGFKSFAQGLASTLSEKSNPLIIASYLGAQHIVFFTIPYMLISRVMSLTTVLSHALMPAFSSMHSTGNNEAVDRYFIVGSKLMLAIIYPSCVGIAVIGEPFIKLWLGPEYADASLPIIITLVCTIFISGALPLHNRLLTAMNKHGSLAKLYLIRAIINIIVAIILVKLMGLVGIALAMLVSNLLISPWIWRAVFDNLESNAVYHIRQNVIPVLFSSICMGMIVFAYKYYFGIESWNSLVTAVILGGIVYPIFVIIFAISKDDRQHIQTLWARAFK